MAPSARGMTLVEVLVALTILGIGLAGVVRLQTWLLATAAESRQLNRALSETQRALESPTDGAPGLDRQSLPSPWPGLVASRLTVRWKGPGGEHHLHFDAIDLPADPAATVGILDGLPPATSPPG